MPADLSKMGMAMTVNFFVEGNDITSSTLIDMKFTYNIGHPVFAPNGGAATSTTSPSINCALADNEYIASLTIIPK